MSLACRVAVEPKLCQGWGRGFESHRPLQNLPELQAVMPADRKADPGREAPCKHYVSTDSIHFCLRSTANPVLALFTGSQYRLAERRGEGTEKRRRLRWKGCSKPALSH
jgi:hypothetical protein